MTFSSGSSSGHAAVAYALQSLVALVAIIALVVAVTAINGRINTLQRSRELSARDSCYLLRGLVQAATPPGTRSRDRAAAYIAATPLRNCDAYGARVEGRGIK